MLVAVMDINLICGKSNFKRYFAINMGLKWGDENH
jgi:hypothetical protein